jgi:NAD(P)-dependent dehydrogenase (short-subunit alcohol dehydrogenase family)
VAVITGGTRGIGAEIVKKLLQSEMTVVIGCRDPQAGYALINSLRSDQGISTGSAECIALNLESLASVREFAGYVLAKGCPINLLVNNAGIMMTPRRLTKDGYESQFQVNYLSHFLLTVLLLPRIVNSVSSTRRSRVINVSSIAHYGGGNFDFTDLAMEKFYSAYLAYFNSKLMQVISSTYLDSKFQSEGNGVHCHSVHPGIVRTDLYQHLPCQCFMSCISKMMFKTPEQGADSVLYACLSPEIENEGGRFYANSKSYMPNSKVFDPNLQKKLWDISCQLCGLDPIEFGKKDSMGT